jgi:FMN-dependent NADH-azoreductase
LYIDLVNCAKVTFWYIEQEMQNVVTSTELAILRTRWKAEKALNHPALAWVDDVPYQ